jgi:hypothetical protein
MPTALRERRASVNLIAMCVFAIVEAVGIGFVLWTYWSHTS